MDSHTESNEAESLLPLTTEQIQQLAAALYSNENHAEFLRKQVAQELELQRTKEDHQRVFPRRELNVSFFTPMHDHDDDPNHIDTVNNDGGERTDAASARTRYGRDEEQQEQVFPRYENEQTNFDPSASFDEIQALRGEVRELKTKISNLQDLRSSRGGVMRPSRLGRSIFSRTFRAVTGPSAQGDENNNAITASLDEDTFSLMMLSEPCSQSWALGLSAVMFQLVLGISIAIDQVGESEDSSRFNVPFKVEQVVRFGQFLSIILCLSTQSDVLTAVQTLVVLYRSDDWSTIIGEEGDYSRALWIRRVVLPNILKITQGLLVLFICFVIIIQSDDIISLLKDFTALMVLSETDNVLFYLAQYGYLGQNLQDKTLELSKIEIEEDANDPALRRKCLILRSSVLVTLISWLFGWWALVVMRQLNGDYFRQKYKKCLNENKESLYHLAKEHFDDGKCYGGPLNTLGCDFEGGDCINFNLAYPLCKGSNLTYVEKLVGDGECHEDFMFLDCDFDGGDCCPYSIQESAYFGDGQCHGGNASTKYCGYDNGDCQDFYRKFPKCPLEDLADVKGSESIILGDGKCDGGIYSSEECGYENGDCDIGQVGQDLTFDDVYSGDINFNFDLSSDGMRIIVGLPIQGLANVFQYDPLKKKWFQIGKSIMAEDFFGWSVAISSSGDKVAISNPAQNGTISEQQISGIVRILQFKSAINDWVQLGKDIEGEEGLDFSGYAIDFSDDGSRLAISAPLNDNKGASAGHIRVFELQPSLEWAQLGGDIYGKAGEEIGRTFLHLSASDGNRVMFSTRESANAVTRLYGLNETSKDWIQIGDDLPCPFSKVSVISADGSRVAISSYSDREFQDKKFQDRDFQVFAPGQVKVFDYDNTNNSWIQVGGTIFATGDDNHESHGFGYSMAMSHDGTQLAIGTIQPRCDNDPFSCSSGTVQFYIYDSSINSFVEPILKVNSFLKERERDRSSSIFGRKLSFGGENGSLLTIKGFNADKGHGFLRMFNVSDLYYSRCLNFSAPETLGDGLCDERYNNEECEFDGGDCLR